MTNPHPSTIEDHVTGAPLPIDKAIAQLEAGKADASICVDLGDGFCARADGVNQLDGLLQRARGLRLLTLMAEQRTVERPGAMRSGKSGLHPVVEEILDALRSSG